MLLFKTELFWERSYSFNKKIFQSMHFASYYRFEAQAFMLEEKPRIR